MTVLCIDDDPDDLEILSDAIKLIDPSIICLTVFRSEDALRLLTSDMELPDFIFLDINMPVMNGLECLRLIKSNEALNSVKVVMLSTAFRPTDEAEFARWGVRYFKKPNEFAMLVENLTRILKS